MRSLARTSLLLAAVLLLGACGSDKPKASSSSSSSSTSSSASKSSSSSSSSATDATDATDSGSDSAAVEVALGADGLIFLTDPTATNVDFGTAAMPTRTALESALGKPKTIDLGRPCEDGSSRTFDSILYDGLVVFFLDSKLSGWSAESKEFTTVDGVGPGSTLADLKKSFGEVTLSNSSLGTEFSTGTIGGVLDGSSDTSTVTTMFNGEVCIIR